jgi:hypothetical protein
MLRHSILAVALIATFAAVVPAQVLLNESFNNNAAGWTMGPQWAIGAATASTTCSTSAGLLQDPGVDADGKAGGGIAGVVLGGCTGTGLHGFYYIESPVIDATGSTSLRLEFDRWLNSDFFPYAQSTIDVWNGSSWNNVFTTAGTATTDSAWSHFAYDITSLATARLKVRFGYAIFQTNVFSHSSWNIDNVRITNGESFFDRFRNNAAGWTLGTEWAIGNATAGGDFIGCAGAGDPGSDADGTASGGVAGVVLGGNATTAGHGYYYLTSPVINTSGSTALELQFDRWLNSDYLGYMDSNIQVWNGATWQTIFSTNFGCQTETAWNTTKYNIQAHSNAALQVRFGVAVFDPNVYSVSSWNIDNLSIHDNGGACVLQYSAYNGPGSVRFSSHCLSANTPPGTLFFQCFTTQGSGPFWFFGINPSLQYEVLSQFQSNALPFVGYSNAQGDLVWDVPTGIPSGLGPFYGVMVAINPSGQVVNYTAPISFVTL